MPQIKFTSHLRQFFPTLRDGIIVEGQTVADIVTALNGIYPGIADYIIDEHGTLRKHVNIFIENELIFDRDRLQDAVNETTRVFIMQALSGG